MTSSISNVWLSSPADTGKIIVYKIQNHVTKDVKIQNSPCLFLTELKSFFFWYTVATIMATVRDSSHCWDTLFLDKSNLRGFVIRKGNGSNNSLFLSCQMGLSDGAFLMIKYTPLPNGNHPISSPVCQTGVADTLEPCILPCLTLVVHSKFMYVRLSDILR